MSKSKITITGDELTEYAVDKLTEAGIKPKAARAIAETIVRVSITKADIAGLSEGIDRIHKRMNTLISLIFGLYVVIAAFYVSRLIA